MCTNLRVTAEDGSVVIARSMEFGLDLGWQLMVAPAGNDFVGTAPSGAGHRWTSTHGAVGVSPSDRQFVTDGVNDAGLFAALLYLPGLAEYQSTDGVDPSSCISADELGTFVLSTAATVQEAVELTAQIVVWNKIEEQLGGTILPVHLVVHDRAGACAVIEWIGGVRTVHDSPIGVCTNNPSYDWHMTNLRNYVNLRANNVDSVTIDGETFAGLGQGTGLLGLPGDWTPPSRFVRAAALSGAVFAPKNAVAAVTTALHMINTFDIPLGLVRNGVADEYTGWVSISDLQNGTYLVRTYSDPTPRQVVLSDLGLDSGPVRLVPMPSDPQPLALVI